MIRPWMLFIEKNFKWIFIEIAAFDLFERTYAESFEERKMNIVPSAYVLIEK